MADPEKKCREIIKRIGECDSVKKFHLQEYLFFKEVLKYHPTNKAEGMVDLKFFKDMFHNPAIKFVRADGTEDTISWVLSSRNMKRGKIIVKDTSREDLIKALRNSIYYQIKEYKTTFDNKFECELCKAKGTSSRDFHVDHILEFKHIKDAFLSRFDPRTHPSTFRWDERGPTFYECDKELEESWKTYHAENASVRILCKTCNLARNRKDKD